MKASKIDEMVSLLVASSFFSMWQSCVCHAGEIAMRQAHRAFNRMPRKGVFSKTLAVDVATKRFHVS